MSITLNCDVCGKVPSPMANANQTDLGIELGHVQFRVTLKASIDLCQECRNEMMRQIGQLRLIESAPVSFASRDFSSHST